VARPGAGRWYAPGDVNAFFGLAVDNLTQLVLLSSLLIGVFGFPQDLVLRSMIPGTAAGVLVGDLAYTWLAIRLMRRSGRDDVTAMPFGIDTPSLFGVVFGVLGPAMLATRDPVLAWRIGMGVTVAMGAAKLVLAFAGDAVRLCPLTLDRGAARLTIESLTSASVSEPGTDLGRALRMAMRVMPAGRRDEQAILLWTDGEDLEQGARGEIEALGHSGIRVFSVGVGTPAGDVVPVLDDHHDAAVLRPSGEAHDPVCRHLHLAAERDGDVDAGVELPLIKHRVVPVSVGRGNRSGHRPPDGRGEMDILLFGDVTADLRDRLHRRPDLLPQ